MGSNKSLPSTLSQRVTSYDIPCTLSPERALIKCQNEQVFRGRVAFWKYLEPSGGLGSRDKSASPPTPTLTFPSVHMSLFSNLHWHFLRCCLSDRGKRKKGLSYMRRIDCYIAFVLSVLLFVGRLTGTDSPPCGIIIGVPRRNAVRRYKQAEWINGSSQVSWMLC